MELVETRLERLEKQNASLAKRARFLTLACAFLALGAVVVFGAGAIQDPGPLNVSQLNVVGPNGKVRMILGVRADGMASIELLDAGSDSHVRIETDEQGGHSAVLMRDIKDNVRIDFGINPQSSAGVLVINGVPK